MSLWKKFTKLSIVLSTVTLAACSTTNTFTTQVNVFQDWPSDAQGKTYAFTKNVEQNLELKTYADAIAQQMWRTGLSLATQPQRAQYLVDFDVRVEEREQIVQDTYYQDPWMFSPYFGWSNFGWGGGPWYGGMSMMYSPRVATYPVRYNRYALDLKIATKQGKPVYQATALADSSRSMLSQVMPYLAASVLDDFPLANGQVKQVTFDIDASNKARIPTKVEAKPKQKASVTTDKLFL